MVTKERMDIFIDEHIHPNINDETRLKVFKLLDDNNKDFIGELEALLTIEDVVEETAEALLLEILSKY